MQEDLKRVVLHAITVTPVDFAVLEGVRTPARQQSLVDTGASQTLKSRHLTGHAVDLGAMIGRQLSWHWAYYYQIAAAMREASIACQVPVEWGGAWGELMTDYEDPETASAAYVKRRALAKRQAFLDGAHFQLPWATYPA